jgi:hypothetical protein
MPHAETHEHGSGSYVFRQGAYPVTLLLHGDVHSRRFLAFALLHCTPRSVVGERRHFVIQLLSIRSAAYLIKGITICHKVGLEAEHTVAQV